MSIAGNFPTSFPSLQEVSSGSLLGVAHSVYSTNGPTYKHLSATIQGANNEFFESSAVKAIQDLVYRIVETFTNPPWQFKIVGHTIYRLSGPVGRSTHYLCSGILGTTGKCKMLFFKVYHPVASAVRWSLNALDAGCALFDTALRAIALYGEFRAYCQPQHTSDLQVSFGKNKADGAANYFKEIATPILTQFGQLKAGDDFVVRFVSDTGMGGRKFWLKSENARILYVHADLGRRVIREKNSTGLDSQMKGQIARDFSRFNQARDFKEVVFLVSSLSNTVMKIRKAFGERSLFLNKAFDQLEGRVLASTPYLYAMRNAALITSYLYAVPLASTIYAIGQRVIGFVIDDRIDLELQRVEYRQWEDGDLNALIAELRKDYENNLKIRQACVERFVHRHHFVETKGAGADLTQYDVECASFPVLADCELSEPLKAHKSALERSSYAGLLYAAQSPSKVWNHFTQSAQYLRDLANAFPITDLPQACKRFASRSWQERKIAWSELDPSTRLGSVRLGPISAPAATLASAISEASFLNDLWDVHMISPEGSYGYRDWGAGSKARKLSVAQQVLAERAGSR